jgi:hypothetical protein
MNARSRLPYLFSLTLLLGAAWNARAGNGSFTTYEIHEQNSLTQTGPSTFVPGIPNDTFQFSIVGSVDTGGANLSAAPILILPTPNDITDGSVTFPAGPNASPVWSSGKGYNVYHWGDGYTTAAELSFIYGTGSFTFVLGNATATPTLSLDTANPAFPISPMLIGGGTWSNGELLIDAATGTTLTFNTSAFTGYSTGLGGQIKLELVDPTTLMPIVTPEASQNAPSLGKTDPAVTSFTIAPGFLVAGETYLFQANYSHYTGFNTTSFTGAGITGSPVGASSYLTSTFITIDAVVPEPSTYVLLGLGGIALFIMRRRKASLSDAS